jgi:uncharacterized protein
VIVDCHTHVWQSPDQLGRAVNAVAHQLRTVTGSATVQLSASAADHATACEPVDAAFVLGFKSHYLGADIPNDFISSYVRQHSDKMIGLAGIDPSRPRKAVDEIHRCMKDLGLRGITIAPSAQNFHPSHTNAMRVYETAVRLRLPVVVNHGLGLTAESRMEFARPVLFDEVARELPELKLIISHMGYPWVDETLVLLAKHPNVYADISGLLHLPWIAYNALVAAYQVRVTDKLLFGSDFPYAWPTQCIEALYGLNHISKGTNLPTIPREQLRGVVERDTLGLLGLGGAVPVRPQETSLLGEEDG